jgi:hypothetical protein
MPASMAGLPGRAGRIGRIGEWRIIPGLRGGGPASAQAAFVGRKGQGPLASPTIGKASAAADQEKARQRSVSLVRRRT